MIVYSADPREGYVTKPAIETMRSSLAREIFQQDLLQIYSEQTVLRDSLTAESRDTLQELLERMRTGTCANPVIEDLMSRLAERLKYTAGKKQYGYMRRVFAYLIKQRFIDREVLSRFAHAVKIGGIHSKQHMNAEILPRLVIPLQVGCGFRNGDAVLIV